MTMVAVVRDVDYSGPSIAAGLKVLFHRLGLDRENFGTTKWNPLGYLIKPGMTVVIKPNFVTSRHKEGKNRFSIITHPLVISAVADYCWTALHGHGRVIVADAPQYDCDPRVLEVAMRHYCPDTEFQNLSTYWSPERHFPSVCRRLPGDPHGCAVLDRGNASLLCGRATDKIYGAVYHRQELVACQSGSRHAYTISKTVLDADVFISVPKLKVHKKVGVTLNVKGLVGIVTNKNCLVHYTLGSPKEGGDQYPDGWFTPAEERLIKLERWMYDHLLAHRSVPLEYLHRACYWLHDAVIKPFGWTVPPEKRLLDAGNWYGNDSAWRMAADLYSLFVPGRRTFSVIDGIIGGENNGPLLPDPKPSGVLIAGEDLLATDIVAIRLMGFNPWLLPLYRHLAERPYDIEVLAPTEWTHCLADRSNKFLNFKPHPGWVGHLEI